MKDQKNIYYMILAFHEKLKNRHVVFNIYVRTMDFHTFHRFNILAFREIFIPQFLFIYFVIIAQFFHALEPSFSINALLIIHCLNFPYNYRYTLVLVFAEQ